MAKGGGESLNIPLSAQHRQQSVSFKAQSIEPATQQTVLNGRREGVLNKQLDENI